MYLLLYILVIGVSLFICGRYGFVHYWDRVMQVIGGADLFVSVLFGNYLRAALNAGAILLLQYFYLRDKQEDKATRYKRMVRKELTRWLKDNNKTVSKITFDYSDEDDRKGPKI